MGLAVGPFFDRAADDQAVVSATGGAKGLLEQDQPPHERAGVAAGIAQQRPASRVVDQAELLPVRIGLPGVVPAKLAVKLASRHIERELDWRDARCPFEHVQLGPDQKTVLQRLAGAHLLGVLGVAQSRGVAHACHDTSGVLGADRTHQVLAQRRQPDGVHQHHAPVAQPDGAAVGLEAQQATQVAVRGVFEVQRHIILW